MQNFLNTKIESDTELLAEIRKGNTKAFDQLFNKYYKNLCRFAYSFIHDEDKSQSLIQNVFIKIWERRLLLGEIKNIGAYLTTMARNQCSDYINDQKNYQKIIQKQKIEEVSFSTEHEILKNNFEEHFIIALSKLPQRCRLAFEYSRFDNMTNLEIAKEMNISNKGVEALIGRSLKYLRQELVELLPSSDIKPKFPILYFLHFSKK